MNPLRLPAGTLLCVIISILPVSFDPAHGEPPAPAAIVSSDRILAEADTLYGKGEKEEAAAYLDRHVERVRAEDDSVSLVKLLTKSGYVRRGLGAPADGVVLEREALEMALALGDSALACAPLRWMAVCLTAQGHNDEARAAFQRLETMAHAVGDLSHEGWANVGLGYDADISRDDERALKHYGRAMELFEKVGDAEAELWAGIGCANARFHQAEYDSAGAGYRRTVELARAAGLQRHEAISLNNLAGLQFALGRPDISCRYYEQAITLWDSIGQPWERIVPALNLGSCLALLGRDEEATEIFEAELAECRSAGYRDYEARALRRLAEQDQDHGQTGAAEDRLREILALGEDLSVLERSEAVNVLAQLLVNEGRCEEARTLLGDMESDFSEENVSGAYMRLNINQGRALICLERYEEALTHLRRANRTRGDAKNRYGLEIEPLLALCFSESEEDDSTLAHLHTAASLWEEDRSLPLDPEWREERGTAGRDIFSRLALRMADREGPEVAFDFVQTYKARTLQERMRGPGRALEEVVADKAPTVSLRELQEGVLTEDELFLDYYLGSDAGALFAITKDDCRLLPLTGEKDLGERLSRFHELLSGCVGSDRDLSQISKTLGAEIFDGVVDLIEVKTKVIFCPDGALNLLPPSCMAPGGPDAVDWTRVPSASILRDVRLPRERGRTHEVLALVGGTGDSDFLPGAVREAEMLAERFADVTIRNGDSLSADRAKEWLEGFDLLHIASHARGDDRHAWQSAIELRGPSPGDPGIYLRAADLAEARLDALMAVLSNCSSAGGRTLSGEGVLGLSSAFLAAGVPTVVATLWAVDDATTARFMAHFYEELARGLAAGAALNRARDEIRRTEDCGHPFYWAGYILVGDGNVEVSLRDAPSNSYLPFLLLLAAGLLILGLVRYRRR